MVLKIFKEKKREKISFNIFFVVCNFSLNWKLYFFHEKKVLNFTLIKNNYLKKRDCYSKKGYIVDKDITFKY